MPATTPPGATSQLLSGQQIGHYQVAAKIGEGGMGEVYRASDTRLNREVALKVLPQRFAADPYRMARFQREAQLLASLNHPKIAAIYGLEESGSTRALVMELVEGPTLAERIGRAAHLARQKGASAPPGQLSLGGVSGSKRGGQGASAPNASKPAIPLDEALSIAQQLAEALEYAHEHGIIHRDLKPANIKITPDGCVKVLDFGLAKAMELENISTEMADSPTLSVAMTQAGFIIGTAAYMAPEQAKGRPVDRRADIWAFGCVFYEMLTGQRAFHGESTSDVIAAVIKGEPDWDALPVDTPHTLQRLVRRCLQKDPKQRVRDIGDARIAIEEALSGEAADASVISNGNATEEPPSRSRLSRMLPWSVAALCVVSTILALFYFRSSEPAAPTTRTLIMAPEKVQFGFSMPDGAPVLSPDGKRLVFPVTDPAGTGSLWVRPLDSLAAQPLQGTEGARFPFWSPDSRQLGFFKDGKLERIDVTGGTPVLICDAPSGRGGTWNKDGVIVFAPEPQSGLSSVPAAGGTPMIVVPNPNQTSDGTASDRWPEFLPDGKHFLYLSGNGFSPGKQDLGIYVAKLGSNETKFLFQADSQALYAAPGYLLFLRGNTLTAQRFNAGSVKLQGEAFPVAENVPSPQSGRLGLFGVSDTGELVYASGSSSLGVGRLEWVDRSGKELGEVGVAQAIYPRLSPDGKQVAYVVGNQNTMYGDIWIIDLARAVKTRFTLISTQNIAPVWSPDGSQIAYGSMNTNKVGVLVKDSSGAGNPELVVQTNRTAAPGDWSRDGRYILYTVVSNANGKEIWSLWGVPQFGDHKPFPYVQDQFSEFWSVFSPNGRWVAYDSDESGESEIYLSPFPVRSGKWQVSQSGGTMPKFSSDGKALYYVAPGGKIMEASVVEKGSIVEIGTPRQLFQMSTLSNESAFDVVPDGKKFLVVDTAQGKSAPLELVTNWAADMRK